MSEADTVLGSTAASFAMDCPTHGRIPLRAIDELDNHYAEYWLSNSLIRSAGALNSAPQVLHADGQSFLFTETDDDRNALQREYFSLWTLGDRLLKNHGRYAPVRTILHRYELSPVGGAYGSRGVVHKRNRAVLGGLQVEGDFLCVARDTAQEQSQEEREIPSEDVAIRVDPDASGHGIYTSENRKASSRSVGAKCPARAGLYAQSCGQGPFVVGVQGTACRDPDAQSPGHCW